MKENLLQKQTQKIAGNLTQLPVDKHIYTMLKHYVLLLGTDIRQLILQKEQVQLDVKQLKKQNIQIGQKALAFVLVFFLLTFFQIGIGFPCLVFGVVGGYFLTKKAIRQQTEQRLLQCTIFWVILALITGFDRILGLVLFFLPFYQCLKLFLFIFLLYPTINIKKRISKDYFIPRIQSIMKVINSRY